MSTDRYERFVELCNAWGIAEVEGDVRPALDALHAALVGNRDLQLRAAQVVVAGRDGERAKGRGAVRALRAKVGSTIGPFAHQPLALAAMLVAALVECSREVSTCLDAVLSFRFDQLDTDAGAAFGWWKELQRKNPLAVDNSHCDHSPEINDGPILGQRSNGIETALQVNSQAFADAFVRLSSNTTTDWGFAAYSANFISVLQGFQDDFSVLDFKDDQPQPRQEALAALKAAASLNHNLSGIGPHFIKFFSCLPPVSQPRVSQFSDFRHLIQHQNTGWNYNGNWAPHYCRLVEKVAELIRAEASLIEIARNLQQTERQTQQLVSNSQTHVQNLIASAHRPETDLLWWGEARYSHSRQLPFRKIADPTARMWTAIAEAADRSTNLATLPAAAYLVRILEDLKLDIDETKPVHAWAADSYTFLRANRSHTREDLIALAKVDNVGLPISTLFQHVQSGDPIAAEHLRATFIDSEAPLDLGDWATWIFYELLLARRLA